MEGSITYPLKAHYGKVAELLNSDPRQFRVKPDSSNSSELQRVVGWHSIRRTTRSYAVARSATC